MKRLVVGLLGPGLVSAGAADPLAGNERVICTGMQYHESLLHEGCQQVGPDDIAAPTVFEIDLDEPALVSRATTGDERRSTIRNHVVIDSKVILQGAEDGAEGIRDGLGWTAAITLDTGVMAMSASSDEVGFVIMGACRAVEL